MERCRTMIDLKALTIYQQWGLAHCTRLANDPIVQRNAERVARDAPPEEMEELYTVQSYADKIMSDACDSYWQQCQQYGLEQQVVPRLMQLTLEEQFALRTQYEIPNVIPNEYLAQLP